MHHTAWQQPKAREVCGPTQDQRSLCSCQPQPVMCTRLSICCPQRALAGGAAAHPLRAANYAALEADLGVKGWTAALAAKGWDRSQPTVWLAEVRSLTLLSGSLRCIT